MNTNSHELVHVWSHARRNRPSKWLVFTHDSPKPRKGDMFIVSKPKKGAHCDHKSTIGLWKANRYRPSPLLFFSGAAGQLSAAFRSVCARRAAEKQKANNRVAELGYGHPNPTGFQTVRLSFGIVNSGPLVVQ
jgi:hypothetical protein